MRTRGVAAIGVVLLVLVAAALLLAGCGSQGPHLPKATVSVVLGPKPRTVTISLTSSGSGVGVAEVVLTHPDRHRTIFGNGVLEDNIGVGFTSPKLPAGDYKYTIYAIPTATTPPDAAFPDSARTEKNVFYRGNFTIH